MLSLEMMPWSNLNNLESAPSVVQGATGDNKIARYLARC